MEFTPEELANLSESEIMARIHADAEQQQQIAEQRNKESKAILDAEFAALKNDEEIQSLTTLSIYQTLLDLQKLLQKLADNDTDVTRKSYVVGNLLRWIDKQIKEEDKKIALKDRL